MLVLLSAALLIACSTGTERGGSCAFRVRLDGRWYVGTGGIRVIPEYGDPLGEAVVPPCGDEDGFRIEAVAIEGVSVELAFASPTREDTVFVAEGTPSLPPPLQRLRREPTCAHEGSPISVRGQWLGIVSADGDTEVDLVPPYVLEVRVVDASVPRYERTFLTIHVAAELGRPLSREDVRSSLWEGATCPLRRPASKATSSPSG